mgnify:CR=1 FL=1
MILKQFYKTLFNFKFALLKLRGHFYLGGLTKIKKSGIKKYIFVKK